MHACIPFDYRILQTLALARKHYKQRPLGIWRDAQAVKGVHASRPGGVPITHRPSKEKSQEVRRREAVRAQLAAITDEYKQAQSRSRDAVKQLKWAAPCSNYHTHELISTQRKQGAMAVEILQQWYPSASLFAR